MMKESSLPTEFIVAYLVCSGSRSACNDYCILDIRMRAPMLMNLQVETAVLLSFPVSCVLSENCSFQFDRILLFCVIVVWVVLTV
jgi:hypothetical protein